MLGNIHHIRHRNDLEVEQEELQEESTPKNHHEAPTDKFKQLELNLTGATFTDR